MARKLVGAVLTAPRAAQVSALTSGLYCRESMQGHEGGHSASSMVHAVKFNVRPASSLLGTY